MARLAFLGTSENRMVGRYVNRSNTNVDAPGGVIKATAGPRELQSPGTGPFFGRKSFHCRKNVDRKHGPVPFALDFRAGFQSQCHVRRKGEEQDPPTVGSHVSVRQCWRCWHTARVDGLPTPLVHHDLRGIHQGTNSRAGTPV